jgi:hypothetical protein
MPSCQYRSLSMTNQCSSTVIAAVLVHQYHDECVGCLCSSSAHDAYFAALLLLLLLMDLQPTVAAPGVRHVGAAARWRPQGFCRPHWNARLCEWGAVVGDVLQEATGKLRKRCTAVKPTQVVISRDCQCMLPPVLHAQSCAVVWHAPCCSSDRYQDTAANPYLGCCSDAT